MPDNDVAPAIKYLVSYQIGKSRRLYTKAVVAVNPQAAREFVFKMVGRDKKVVVHTITETHLP